MSILNSLEIIKTLTKFIVGITTFISSIAVFSLIVGLLGIIITIYTSVIERTREIGILKALGGTNKTILTMFLTESDNNWHDRCSNWYFIWVCRLSILFRGFYILFKIANKNISCFQCNRDIKNFYQQ